MKTPLRYQVTEYDCGPTSLLNTVSFLFEREEIPPEVVRNIMLYSLDTFGTDGVSGKRDLPHRNAVPLPLAGRLWEDWAAERSL